MQVNVPGPPAQVLAAVLREDPSNPPVAGDRHRATFATTGFPNLPSLMTEVVAVPQFATLDMSAEFTGTVTYPGCAPVWQPGDNGWLIANSDPAAAGNATTTSTSTVYLQKLSIYWDLTISTLTWICTSAGSGTSTGTFAGLYSPGGAKLTGSADMGTTFAATGAIACPLTTPQALGAGSFVWAALLVNLGTTQPSLARFATSSTIANAGLTAASYRWATNGTGTSLPSSITPASNATTALTWFVAGS